MRTEHSFSPSDRYHFDFGECSERRGFCQIDTTQDAPYFGIWCDPFGLRIVTYCEGDVTRQWAENEAEFADEIRNLKDCYAEGFLGIDPGWHPERFIERFTQLGLSELLH
jgi:hypothetical protein